MSFQCFNQRTREGCDKAPLEIHVGTIQVSIHAPVKGATHNP